EGYFVTERAEYYNQLNVLFGTAEVTYFKYLPPEQAAAAPSSTGPQKIERIRPVENHDSKHYWQGLRDGKLLIQKCDDCQTHRHPPQPMCEKCQSLNWSATESALAGSIHSFTVMHYPEIPPFDYPNAIVLVDLDEGVRITSQLEGVDPQDIQIGSRVIAQIKEVQDGLSLPIFGIDTSSTN
ncbi:MAG: putative OB-fold protein, partial [Arenicella sp.]